MNLFLENITRLHCVLYYTNIYDKYKFIELSNCTLFPVPNEEASSSSKISLKNCISTSIFHKPAYISSSGPISPISPTPNPIKNLEIVYTGEFPLGVERKLAANRISDFRSLLRGEKKKEVSAELQFARNIREERRQPRGI